MRKRWSFRIGQQFTWERNFKGDFRKSFIQVNRKTICESKCTWKKNLFVAAKRIPVEQRKQIVEIVGTGSKEDKEHHRDIINENEVTDRVNAIDKDSSISEERFSDI